MLLTGFWLTRIYLAFLGHVVYMLLTVSSFIETSGVWHLQEDGLKQESIS